MHLGLNDSHGRVATDLRVSLTDRCNLRCTYCMPPEGVPLAHADTLLTDDEVVRLVDVAITHLGVRTVRLTGGEPLLRRGLVDIVSRLAALGPDDLSMTTNGIGLVRLAEPLAAAGLDRVNVSLDAVDADLFRSLSLRDRLDDVLAGIAAARSAGLTPVKVNSVLMRGVNDHHAPALLHWALEEGLELRFIEQMPLDAQGAWQRDSMVTADEVATILDEDFLLEPQDGRGAAPAETYRVTSRTQGSALSGTVGLIASVTRPFCSACNRVRLTADGQVRNCLFATRETDLRTLLRSGASDEALAVAWRGDVAVKAAAHGISSPGFTSPERPMSAIGG